MQRCDILLLGSLALFIGAGVPYVVSVALMGFNSIVNEVLFYSSIFGMMMVILVSVVVSVNPKRKKVE